MLKKALPLSSYLIEALSQGLDLAVLEDRNAFIEEASPLVRKTKSALLRDGLIERLSTAVGYKNSDELRKLLGEHAFKFQCKLRKTQEVSQECH